MLSEDKDEIEELMSEAPNGPNYGRARIPHVDGAGGRGKNDWLELGHPEFRDFCYGEGWHLERGTAHRGPTFPGEYVDQRLLQRAVEHELGFTLQQVRSVYRQGKLSDTQSELRAMIDARMLALSRSGANMLALARVLGLRVDSTRHCRALNNALERARWVEEVEALL